LVVNVEEAQLGKVVEGQTVALQVPAYPGETFRGSVRAIAPTIDPKSRTASVRVAPVDPEARLRAGISARLTIVTGARQNALGGPREALLMGSDPSDAAVIAVGQDNRVQRLPIRVGLMNDRLVEVLSGVAEGQTIVTSGLSNLTDGDLVAPQLSQQT